jgi:hypothetical protein
VIRELYNKTDMYRPILSTRNASQTTIRTFSSSERSIGIGYRDSSKTERAINIGWHIISKYLPGTDLKNLRLIDINNYYACDIQNKFLGSVSFMEFRSNISNEKLKFILNNKFNYQLSLITKCDMGLFYALLCSDKIDEATCIKFNKIESLYVSDLDREGIKIFKEILMKIEEKENLFINLKKLITYQFANFIDCTIPKCIESFESLGDNQHVSIFSSNLKSIKIGCILDKSSVKLEVPSLVSIDINELNCDVKIYPDQHLNLASVKVNGKPESFKSGEALLVLTTTVTKHYYGSGQRGWWIGF